MQAAMQDVQDKRQADAAVWGLHMDKRCSIEGVEGSKAYGQLLHMSYCCLQLRSGN
jgi:hypothetical protein